jgi:intracellular multiplication protein IcmL
MASPSKTLQKPSAGKPPGPLETVVTRNLFYRDGYRNLIKIAVLQGLAIVALICALAITIAVSRPEDRFFATTADGRLIRMIPLNEPNMNDAAIVSWAARAASDVMTFGFHDYQRRLQESSSYFTRRGWQSFTEALDRSRVMEGVEKAQQVVTAAPKSAPVIVQQGLVDGIYRWIVELPLIVTYQSGTAQQSDTIGVQLVIVRVSTLDSPSGVGIQQWIAR